jgi:glycine cleavage system H protein
VVVIAVVLTIVALLLVDWAIQRSRQRSAEAARETGGLFRVPDLSEIAAVPAGVFVAPGHAWVRLEDSGAIRVGADRLPAALLGGIERLDVLRPGAEVRAGDPVVSFRHGERSIELRSPVDGVIAAVNPGVESSPARVQADPFNKGWIYRISPRNLGRALRRMFLADEAAAWMRDELRALRDHLTELTGRQPESSPTMADGGVPVHGVAAGLEPDAWRELTKRFFGGSAQAVDDER